MASGQGTVAAGDSLIPTFPDTDIAHRGTAPEISWGLFVFSNEKPGCTQMLLSELTSILCIALLLTLCMIYWNAYLQSTQGKKQLRDYADQVQKHAENVKRAEASDERHQAAYSRESKL